MEEPVRVKTSNNLALYGIVICSLGGSLWLMHMIYTAINMIISGRGLETYRTFWLVQFNWHDFLAFAIVCAVAIATCLWLRWYEQMQWKSLQKKYGRHKRTPN